MDYEKYNMSFNELIQGIAAYIAIDGIIAFFFYKSWIVFAGLIPGFCFFYHFFKKKLIKDRKKRFLDEFSEALCSVSINMKSGYSIENAFIEAYKDMIMFYGEKSLMAAEIMRIRKGLEINITLEELIDDLAKRCREKEVIMFSEVIKSAKRNGGNITEVLANTADRIRSGICIDQEIDTILSEKKLELRIMEAVPFLLMGYLEVTSVGYFDALYSGLSGRLFMTMCLAIYIAAIMLGARILKIEV